MSISVLILTQNEAENLPRCLESVRWSDDIVVLDDGSTDGTIEIARRAGAHVVEHSAPDEKSQREFSLREIDFRHKWVFNPDADEIATPELVAEMQTAAADTSRPMVAYRVRFKTIFMGKWLRFSSLYPTWVVRLFQPETISFQRTTNLTYEVEGPVGRLQEHFLHYTFNKGLHAWFDKHNNYSDAEALEALAALDHSKAPWGSLIAPDSLVRRQAIKEVSFRLPFRPTLRFLYMYLLRGGFLDGRPGLTYLERRSLIDEIP
jgi:glycosyltransferase involved in cell wall biosynthesis